MEQLTVEGLRNLARQANINLLGTRTQLIDNLMDYYESNGWPNQARVSDREIGEVRDGMPRELVPLEQNLAGSSAAAGTVDNAGGSQHVNSLNDGRENAAVPNNLVMQDVVRAVIEALESRSRNEHPAVNQEHQRYTPNDSTPRSRSEVRPNIHINWNEIKFITKLIPSFTGKDEESVERWIQRISSVGRIHHVPEEALVLAAVNQLGGRALDWYNRQPVETVVDWEEFKYKIRIYFERRESYTMTIARINSRVWKSNTEKFVDYAEDKLKLMQLVNLTEAEQIEILADGVKDSSLRRLVLNTWAVTVPEFINYVRRITEDRSVPDRRVDNHSNPIHRRVIPD